MQPRRRFALTGRSTIVDPRTQPVRRDLAAIELADRVFAPHYAEHVMRSAIADSAIRQSSRLDSEKLGALAPGDAFELYELSSEQGWGRSVASGAVGFVDAAALGPHVGENDTGHADAA
ncbi:SH3 domain-containing protein [Sphingomonas sp. AX6]|uniref:SH3 domain-containing protein n=1 Tax=Sphingomonas sp. AX6 TaxID=2653171 RepID=UPI0012F146F4|nr:SH3 domain-containing protein [Sphingomonas sp. AX6]VXC97246.1 conserved hypothetical protein [Sphingomonas sp. AX6]